jgi:hypothetical protein
LYHKKEIFFQSQEHRISYFIKNGKKKMKGKRGKMLSRWRLIHQEVSKRKPKNENAINFIFAIKFISSLENDASGNTKLFNGENEMSPKDIRQKCIKYNPILRK